MADIPKLFELMEARNITNKQLADAIGVSAGNISDWKSSRSKPSTDVLIRLAKYFEVSTDYLLGITSGQAVDEKFTMILVENDTAKLVPILQQRSDLRDLIQTASALKPDVVCQMTRMAGSFLENSAK